MKATKIAVKQDPENEITTEVLASAIVDISTGIKKLRSGRLTDEALVLLIHHAVPASRVRGSYGQKPSQKTIRSVLNAVENLAAMYVKKARVS